MKHIIKVALVLVFIPVMAFAGMAVVDVFVSSNKSEEITISPSDSVKKPVRYVTATVRCSPPSVELKEQGLLTRCRLSLKPVQYVSVQ